ncbi:Fic family protein [Prosthecobacter sp.]|uniref:Fic family protein n=1 Tax=Prosthecobacter sp. TaxID=1965333 RepID=UPI0024893C07|nr:Fic family protein [Prosthecobacter sp.]MDI1314038.1 Fic family protein [Prosthecobacter sp.]
MPTLYTPPFTLTSKMLHFVAEISAEMGRQGLRAESPMAPTLRRGNRLKSIQASLAIENNSLSLEQVTAVVAGRRVLGPPQEIQEVRNAFAAYEAMEGWKPWTEKHFLAAHRLLMQGLVGAAGRYRQGGVGIAQGTQIVHVAPPAARVPGLMKDLLGWLKRTDAHPLISSCVFHYELEFIHPFADGNGRMGRLWQTLILSTWHPLLAYLPVETVIRARQTEYYQVLAASDRQGNSTLFIEFILSALLQALREGSATDQVSDQVSDQVRALLKCLGTKPASALECMRKLGLSHRPTFRKNYLQPALDAGLIERTLPDKPNSRLQKYRRREV